MEKISLERNSCIIKPIESEDKAQLSNLDSLVRRAYAVISLDSFGPWINLNLIRVIILNYMYLIIYLVIVTLTLVTPQLCLHSSYLHT